MRVRPAVHACVHAQVSDGDEQVTQWGATDVGGLQVEERRGRFLALFVGEQGFTAGAFCLQNDHCRRRVVACPAQQHRKHKAKTNKQHASIAGSGVRRYRRHANKLPDLSSQATTTKTRLEDATIHGFQIAQSTWCYLVSCPPSSDQLQSHCGQPRRVPGPVTYDVRPKVWSQLDLPVTYRTINLLSSASGSPRFKSAYR